MRNGLHTIRPTRKAYGKNKLVSSFTPLFCILISRIQPSINFYMRLSISPLLFFRVRWRRIKARVTPPKVPWRWLSREEEDGLKQEEGWIFFRRLSTWFSKAGDVTFQNQWFSVSIPLVSSFKTNGFQTQFHWFRVSKPMVFKLNSIGFQFQFQWFSDLKPMVLKREDGWIEKWRRLSCGLMWLVMSIETSKLAYK